MLEFEWDNKKNKSNIEKHKLPFELAKYVFECGNFERYIDDKKQYNETRYIGFGELENILFCVSYTIRKNKIRIISFRRARQKELDKVRAKK
ncbi:BrnT family toxin [Francisella frigiditurris]|uniref:BrnT family toxin n=1 Tax=Francisella frigiditurris TaxID=1542390 RepID=A0A1J0KW99_9GAMM|nr:BrnT family toxin [Francisella frigiditurris]APC98007.1 hypothetical protein KX01_1863 [Francisella frigiditurris]